MLALGAIVVLSLGATNVFSGWRFYSCATAAHWLNDNTHSHTEVAITEFGLFGWEVDRPLVEYVGLLSAQSVEDLRNHGLVARAERARLLGGARAPLGAVGDRGPQPPVVPAAHRPVHEIGPDPDIQTLRIYRRVRPIDEAQARTGSSVEPETPASGGIAQVPGGAGAG